MCETLPVVCVCVCACVHNRFGSADSVHVHLNCSTQRHHRKPQETEFDAISISMRKHKQDFLFFYKYSVSPMARMPSIGSLQPPSYAGGGIALKTETMLKKEKRLLKDFWCFLHPLTSVCVSEGQPDKNCNFSPGKAVRFSQKTVPILFIPFFLMFVLCFITHAVIVEQLCCFHCNTLLITATRTFHLQIGDCYYTNVT